MGGLGPVAVVVHLELSPAQLAAVRADVRAQLVALVTSMAGDDLADLIRDTVYRVVREDVDAARQPIDPDPPDEAVAALDGATRAAVSPDDQTGPRP